MYLFYIPTHPSRIEFFWLDWQDGSEVKMLATEPGELSLIPGINKVEGDSS